MTELLGRQWRELRAFDEDETGWMHSGIAVTSVGEVVVASPDGDALVFLGRSGHELRRLHVGTTDLHAIVPEVVDGREWFWLVDHGHKFLPDDAIYADCRLPARVFAVTADGVEQMELFAPQHPAYAESGWSPTSLAVEGSGVDRRFWVADGYGASLVHVYAGDGTHVLAVDGSETGASFACPHGIIIDTRADEPVAVVADRANRRLVELDLGGRAGRVLAEGVVHSPSGLAVDGDLLLVAELWGDLVVLDANGALVDRVGEVRAEPEHAGWPNAMRDGSMVRPGVREGHLNSPHGVAVDPTDGVWFLTEWFIGGRVLSLVPLAL